MEKVSSVMALSFKIEKASGSVCMNCTFKFYFVIKIGTKDTKASLIVLYLRFILFWRSRDILYHFGVIKGSLLNFQFPKTAQKSSSPVAR